MSLFTRLPVSAPNNIGLPFVSEADINYFGGYEPNSYAHWIFNKGNSSGLTSLNDSKTLTVQSTSPTYFKDCARVDIYPSGKALQSDFVDVTNASDTVCMVVNDPETAGGAHMLWGSFESGVNTGGGVLTSQVTRTLLLAYAGINLNINTGLTLPSRNGKYFVAVSRDFSGDSNKITALVGGQSAFVNTYTGAYNPGGVRTIDVGATRYTSTAISKAHNDVYEFIIFPKALTASELQSVYLKRKSKLSALGIEIV